jgi:hypothetical protein
MKDSFVDQIILVDISRAVRLRGSALQIQSGQFVFCFCPPRAAVHGSTVTVIWNYAWTRRQRKENRIQAAEIRFFKQEEDVPGKTE